MSDKLNFSPASLSTLQSFSLLALEGPDAVAFIQAQSMNDVNSLADGQWHWNGLLNPKGRVIALFAVLRLRGDLLYLLLPDFPAEKLGAHLQRFIFRSKVKLLSNIDVVFAADFTSPLPPGIARNQISGDLEQGLALDFSTDTLMRRLWLLDRHSAENVLPDDEIEAQWRDQDIQHGLPRLSDAQSELWTPQMLSLDQLNAFSLKKGCYPGQEIVARTHYLGQAKRQTRLILGQRLSLQAPIYRGTDKVGELICVSSKNDMGLALLQNIGESDELVCCEKQVKHLQALTGLQRSN